MFPTRFVTRGLRGWGKAASRSLTTAPMPCIDVHTHMYLPKYMEILKKRSDIPKVLTIGGEDRLVILPGEDDEVTTSTGRPIGREYWDVNAKLEYMKNHNISHSVVSLANPWLDFLTGNEAESCAQELNDELQGTVPFCLSLCLHAFVCYIC
jgi:aminocarboxymuconate-semialdehyde decarboxylase